MKTNIFPCLWFDGKAKAAADFYCSIFPNSIITSESSMAVIFRLEGTTVMGLNGGPMFTINPSISFFVTCETDEEIERFYKQLREGGKDLMALGSYPWSEKYAWISDQFGMSWQLMRGEISAHGQKIVPSFLFSNEQFGKARKAIDLYTSIFSDSTILHQEIYKEEEVQPAGNLKFGQFSLSNQLFNAMDGPGNHDFNFNEAVSLVVECKSQAEIDSFWEQLTQNGGVESRCGWLKDPFGVSWQIIPENMGQLMSSPEKAGRVIQELMKMNKLDIETLRNA